MKFNGNPRAARQGLENNVFNKSQPSVIGDDYLK